LRQPDWLTQILRYSRGTYFLAFILLLNFDNIENLSTFISWKLVSSISVCNFETEKVVMLFSIFEMVYLGRVEICGGGWNHAPINWKNVDTWEHSFCFLKSTLVQARLFSNRPKSATWYWVKVVIFWGGRGAFLACSLKHFVWWEELTFSQ